MVCYKLMKFNYTYISAGYQPVISIHERLGGAAGLEHLIANLAYGGDLGGSAG